MYRRFIADTNLTLSELDELSLSKIPETSYVRDQILFLLVDDDDIDYKRKVYTLKIGVVTSGLKGYFVKTSCYDTMESLGIDPEELNLALYDRKKATVTVVEVEDFSSQVLKKQIQNLRNGLGKKVKLSLFESYISSKDCSYGGTDTQATKKDVEEAENLDL